MISTHSSSWNSTIKWCIQTCQFILIHYLLSEIKTFMATIHDAEIKLVQSEINMNLLKRCIRYSLAHTIKSLPSCIQDKIFTHSLSGLSIYSKQFLLNKYESNCQIINCYICNWCGIFNLHTDVYIHAQTLCFIVFIIYVLIKMRCFFSNFVYIYNNVY